jgi:hypothetical protein
MDLRWTDERCILCTLKLTERRTRRGATAELTQEHLIPAAIGGRLTCNFLCKHCNDTLGQLEARLKGDARIRLAINSLKSALPELWASMSEGGPYIAVGPDGTLGAKLKNGEVRVNSSRRPDGSLIQPLTDAAKTVRTVLRRSGATQEEISNAEMKLKELPEGVRFKVANRIEVLKSTPATAYPALKSQGIEPRALLKIAYEYLALHFGSKIFHQYFDPVRLAFLPRGVLPNYCSVQEGRVRERKSEPFHGLAVKNTSSGLVVKIRLFGYLSYPVHFFGLQILSAKSYCYTLDLDAKQEELVEVQSA